MKGHHDKDRVLPQAQPLWPEILRQLAGMDDRVFSGKHQPCPLCGGKDRFRYIRKHDNPLHCNQCGDWSGIDFYREITGVSFADAINDVGDWLNLVPVQKREQVARSHAVACTLPDWYAFDVKLYDQFKEAAVVGISPWQRVCGLSVLDILKHGDDALLPLLDGKGKAFDFVTVNIDGDWQTTACNKSVPPASHSVFGDDKGKRTYIAIDPYHAAHAAIFTRKQVVCCYEVENIWPVAMALGGECVVIVTSIEENKEADSVGLSQLTFNKQNNTVNRRLYKPFEIVGIKEKGYE